MIYRRWSLFTGPPVILAGIVGTVIVGHFLFIENDWLNKPKRDADRKEGQAFSGK